MEQQTYTREEFLLQQHYYHYNKRREIAITVLLTLGIVTLILIILRVLDARFKRYRTSSATEEQLYQLGDRNLYVRRNGRLVRLVPATGAGWSRRWSWGWKRRGTNLSEETRANSVVLEEERAQSPGAGVRLEEVGRGEGRHDSSGYEEADIADRRWDARD